jgi:hypothetical protein
LLLRLLLRRRRRILLLLSKRRWRIILCSTRRLVAIAARLIHRLLLLWWWGVSACSVHVPTLWRRCILARWGLVEFPWLRWGIGIVAVVARSRRGRVISLAGVGD